MYSPAARARRRCTATNRNGTPCRNYALWHSPDGVCLSHSPRQHRGPQQPREPWDPLTARPAPEHKRRTPMTCTCAAYRFPHRKGSGWCRWPDAPLVRLSTPPSTHRWPRVRRPQWL
jgi:hypothetical protein